MIDTLRFANELEAAGVDRRQAEAHARALQTAVEGETVSRGHFDAELARIDGRLRLMQWMIGSNTALVLITLAAVLAT